MILCVTDSQTDILRTAVCVKRDTDITHTVRQYTVCSWADNRRIPTLMLGPTPKNPLILCHGLMDIGRYFRMPYFHQISDALRSLGCTVFEPLVPHAASIERRASALLAYISGLYASGQICHEQRVNIIAHSLGGLDARHVVTHLHGYCHIASITTIATPHRGTTLADWGVSTVGQRLKIETLFALAGIDTQVFYDLTTTSLRKFNIATPDHVSVKYFSFGACKAHYQLPYMLRPSHAYINSREGDNDGLVSVASSKWGEYLGTISADHYEQVNWVLPGGGVGTFNATMFYRDTVARILAERGL